MNTDADLLVVGMGPAGDVLAGLARLHGLSVVAIDQAPAIHPLPRAAVFDHEIMRIFQILGVAGDVLPQTRKVERYQFLTAAREVLLDFALDGNNPVSGWGESYALHQPAVEACLRARLGELGVTVSQNTALRGLAQDGEFVTATLESPAGVQTVRTRYLVGCDGATSAVRGALGIKLMDLCFDEPWLVLDTIMADNPGLPDGPLQICDPRRPVTFMRLGERRYRWEFMILPGEDPAVLLAPETIATLLAPWNIACPVVIERKAVYRFHGLLAENWRQGRVLIAGDAAHQMPPFAGQGMCSSIRDAANLAWKLAYVCQGRATPALLDTYQQERAPHVRQIVDTAIAMGRVVCILDEHAAAERNAGMLARKAAGETDISLAMPDLAGGLLSDTPGAGSLFPQPVADGARLDDVLGLGPWLIGQTAGLDASDAALFSLDDPAVAPFAAALRGWLENQDAEAVLVRPDRIVFGTGTGSWLLGAWRAALDRPAYTYQLTVDFANKTKEFHHPSSVAEPQSASV
jgi:3-(3-hydroxy-phenyl)propionate hydroxylase